MVRQQSPDGRKEHSGRLLFDAGILQGGMHSPHTFITVLGVGLALPDPIEPDMDAEIRLACVDLETGRQFNLLQDSAEGATSGVRDSTWQATMMRGALALRQARVGANGRRLGGGQPVRAAHAVPVVS